MRSFIQAALAVAVVLGAVAIAPGGAEAQECAQHHFDWVASAPAGSNLVRSEKIQVVEVHDTAGWTGQAVLSLAYTPGHFQNPFFTPARLSGQGSMAFSDRSWCAQSGGFFCDVTQFFSAYDLDAVKVTLTRGLLASNPLTFRFDALRWGGFQTSTNGVCLNNNTVSYAFPGDVTYLVTFTDVEVDHTPPK